MYFDCVKARRDVYVAALIRQIVEHVEPPRFIVCYYLMGNIGRIEGFQLGFFVHLFIYLREPVG